MPTQDAIDPASKIAQFGQVQQLTVAQASPPRPCAGWNHYNRTVSQITRSCTKVESPIAIHFLVHSQPKGWPRPLPGSLLRKLQLESTRKPSLLVLYNPERHHMMKSLTLLDLVYLICLCHIAYCICRAIVDSLSFW